MLAYQPLSLQQQKPVDDHKLSHYTQGLVRKSKREREKEAAEAKRKEEEADAARIYAEFLNAFEGEEADRKKGGSMFVKSGQEAVYTPSAKPPRAPRMFEETAAVRVRFNRSIEERCSLHCLASLTSAAGSQTERQTCNGFVS